MKRPKLPPFKRYVPRLSGPSEHELALRKVLERLPPAGLKLSDGPALLAAVESLERDGEFVSDGEGCLVGYKTEVADQPAFEFFIAVTCTRRSDPALRS